MHIDEHKVKIDKHEENAKSHLERYKLLQQQSLKFELELQEKVYKFANF